MNSEFLPDLGEKVALVTGASRGLGSALAKQLAARGAHVVMVARSVPGLEAVDDEIRAMGKSATLIPLDLLKLDEIANLGPALYNRFGRLDILIANAGMLGHLGPVAHFESKIWDRVMTLNFTANHRLIQTLDPLLRVGPQGRAMFVTDGRTQALSAYGGAYAASKAALETMVRLYAAEMKSTRLSINLIDPGIMRTNLRAHGFPGEDASLLPSPEDVAARLMHRLFVSSVRPGETIQLAG